MCFVKKAFKSDGDVLLKVSEKELIVVQMINAVGEKGIAVIARNDIGYTKSASRLVEICAGKLCDLRFDRSRIFGEARSLI